MPDSESHVGDVYHCCCGDSQTWYLLVAEDQDYLRTPKGNIHESPAEETYAWLTDDDWTCGPMPIDETPFWGTEYAK